MSENKQSRIEALFRSYRASLPGLLTELGATWSQLEKCWDAELAAEFDRKVHGIAGSAATFELAEIGALAGKLEQCFKPLLDMEYDRHNPRWVDSSQLLVDLKLMIESTLVD